MKPALEILRGELERLFSNSSLKELCSKYLGLDADEAGLADEAKAVFARRLVDWCEKDRSTEALADAVMMEKKGMVDPRVKQIYEIRFPVFELENGAEVAGFVVDQKFGEGGLGSMYLAKRKDADDDAKYAIKVIRAEHALDGYAARRFTTFMRILKTVDNPAIPAVEAVGNLEDGRPFVVTRWKEGKLLDTLKPLPVLDALVVFEAVVDGLDAIHERGLFHLDLNLQNVKVGADDEGTDQLSNVELLGFGVNRLFYRPEPSAGEGVRKYGRFNGMSPEQARGTIPDVRSDIYGLGVLLYEMVAGEAPFTGRTPIDVVAAHLLNNAPPLAEKTEAPEVEAIAYMLTKMLSKEPTGRLQNLDEVRRMLEEAKREAETIVARAAQTGTREDIEVGAEALIADPADAEALEELKNEARAANAWGPAVEVLEEAALASDDALVSRTMLINAAEAAVKYTKDFEKAGQIYNQFLEANADDEEVKDAMLGLLREEGRYDELIEKLAAKAEVTEDAQAKLGFIGEIANVYEFNLKQYENAFQYCMAALNGLVVNNDLVGRLEKLAERTNRFEDLAAALTQAAQVAENAGNAESAVFYYGRTGSCYIEKVNQPSYALTCFQKVLEFQPANTEALEAMSDLYRSAQQWGELAAVITRLAEIEQTPSLSRNRKVDAARIMYERQSETDAAHTLLEEVLNDDPSHEAAVDLLAKIFESTESWDRLAKLLSTSIDSVPDGEQKLATCFRLGEMYEDRLDDLKSAREYYEKVIEVDDRHLDALKGLERIFARDGDVTALRDNLEAQLEVAVTPKQRMGLMERLADIYEEEFKDHDKSIENFLSVLEIDEHHTSALVALTRLYRKTERWEDLVDTLRMRADATDDVNLKKEMLVERAQLIKEKIGDAKRAAEAFGDVAALGADGDLDELARAQVEAGDFDAAVETINKMINEAGDTRVKLGLLLRLSGLQLDKLEDATEAAQTMRRAKELAPNDHGVIEELRRVYVAQGNYASAMDILEEELTMVEGSTARAEIFAQMGVICSNHIDDSDRAVGYFEQAIELDESNLTASDNLGTLYRKRGEWEKALPIYKRWADAADSLDNEKKIELFTQMGEAYDHVDQHESAIKAFARATDVAGDDPALVKRLAEVALNSGENKLAREKLEKYLKLAGDNLDANEKVQVIVMLGNACIGSDDVKEAAKLARQATVMAPDNMEARMLLADVHEKRGDYRGMVEAIQRVLSMTDEDAEERVKLLRRGAKVLFEKLKDPDGAANMLREALHIVDDDRTTLGELLKIYSTTERFKEVIEIALRIAELVDDEGQRARYLFTVAKIYRRSLKDNKSAISYFEQALEADPLLGDARKTLIELFTADKDWDRLQRMYKKSIAALPKDADVETKIGIYEPLAELLNNQLNKPKDAIMLYEAMVKLDPGNIKRREKLVDAYGWGAEYSSKATKIHRRILDSNPARVDSFRSLYRIFSADEEPDQAWCASALLSLLNQASPEERSFYRDNKPEDLPTMESRLQDEHWKHLLYHPDMNQTISSIFSIIDAPISNSKSQDFARFGINPNDAINVTSDSSAASGFVNFAAGALGITPPSMFYHDGQETGFGLAETNPPSLITSNKSSALKDRVGIAFALGQHLCLMRPGLFVNKLITSGTELSAWLLASIKSFVPTLPVPGELAGTVNEKLSPIRQSLSTSDFERLQGYVQSFVSQAADVNLKRWAKSVDYTADRSGLLLCGDVAVAVRILKTQIKDKKELADRLKALTLFTVSEEHFELRQKLGTALKNG